MWRFHAEGLAPEAWTTAPCLQPSAVTASSEQCSEVCQGRSGLVLHSVAGPTPGCSRERDVMERGWAEGPLVVRGIPTTDLGICFRGARCNGIGLRSSFCPGHC